MKLNIKKTNLKTNQMREALKNSGDHHLVEFERLISDLQLAKLGRMLVKSPSFNAAIAKLNLDDAGETIHREDSFLPDDAF